MNVNHKAKATERERRQARQARRIVNGIFIALVVLMVVCISLAAILS